MTAVNVPPVWKHLGKEMTRRRIQLGYDKRKALLDVPGAPSYTLLSDIELGNRPNYGDGEIARIERTYRLPFGAIDRYVAGDVSRLEVLEDDDELGQIRVELERRGLTPGSLRQAIRLLSAVADLVDGDGDDRKEFQAVG